MNPVSLNLLQVTRKVVGVGRNYVMHAKELGNPVPKTPIIFLKPSTSLLPYNSARPQLNVIEIPGVEAHHEVELALVIGKTGRDISPQHAFDHVYGYTVALDMTERDQQAAAKKDGLPWTVAKGYDTFTPIHKVIPKAEFPDPHNVQLWCEVNGEMRQKGNTREMLFNIPTIIAYISSIMTLERGDLILTGTPAGVGPVRPGDKVKAGITDVLEMEFTAAARPRPKL